MCPYLALGTLGQVWLLSPRKPSFKNEMDSIWNKRSIMIMINK